MKILELRDTKGGKIFVNCNAILWFQGCYDEKSGQLCEIHLNNGDSVKVKE